MFWIVVGVCSRLFRASFRAVKTLTFTSLCRFLCNLRSFVFCSKIWINLKILIWLLFLCMCCCVIVVLGDNIRRRAFRLASRASFVVCVLWIKLIVCWLCCLVYILVYRLRDVCIFVVWCVIFMLCGCSCRWFCVWFLVFVKICWCWKMCVWWWCWRCGRLGNMWGWRWVSVRCVGVFCVWWLIVWLWVW